MRYRCPWYILTIVVRLTSFAAHLREEKDVPERATFLALNGDLTQTLMILEDPNIRSALNYRCAALLRVLTNEPLTAQILLKEARTLPMDHNHVGQGHRGGCPVLQSFFFSAAVVLMRLRDESEASGWAPIAMSCDEHVSVAHDLAEIGLAEFSASHLATASSIADLDPNVRDGVKRSEVGDAKAGGVCTHSSTAIALHDALTCPHYFESFEDVAKWRTRIETRVLKVWQGCSSTPRLNGSSPLLADSEVNSYSVPGTFDIVYMGLNDAPLMGLVASTYSCLQPKLTSVHVQSAREPFNTREHVLPPVAAAAEEPSSSPRPTTEPPSPPPKNRTVAEAQRRRRVVKVGFLSAHFRRHSVCKLWCGMIATLREPHRGFQVHVILASDEQQDEWTTALTGGASPSSAQFFCPMRTRQRAEQREASAGSSSDPSSSSPGDTAAAAVDGHSVLRISNQGPFDGARRVAQLGLDVLVYPAIGMHQATYMWCLQRLAPVQVATWGHPVTSGSPAIDFFVSSDLFHDQLTVPPHPVRRRLALTASGKHINSSSSTSSSSTSSTDTFTESRDSSSNRTHIDSSSRGRNSSEAQAWFTEQLVRFDTPGFFFPWPVGADAVLRGEVSLKQELTEAGVFLETTPTPTPTPTGSRELHAGETSLRVGKEETGKRGGPSLPLQSPHANTTTPSTLPLAPKLVACPQALMKLHPSFDAVLLGILHGDPSAHLVLLHDPSKPQHRTWRRRLLARFKAHHPSSFSSSSSSASSSTSSHDVEAEAGTALSRVHFLGRLSPAQFLELLRVSDLVLDPFPFGGGVTSLEGFAVCAPVLTCPSCQSVPQLAAGMYRAMGIAGRQDDEEEEGRGPETVTTAGAGAGANTADTAADDSAVPISPLVASPPAFISAALALLRDARARNYLRAAICDRRSRLFEDVAAAEEWTRFLRVIALPLS